MSYYKVTITEITPSSSDSKAEEIEIYAQRLEEIHLPTLIRAINSAPKKRGPKTGSKTEGARL